MTLRKKRYQLEDFTNLSDRQRGILAEQNVTTIDALSMIPIGELKAILDTTLNKAGAILKEARDSLPPFRVQTAKNMLDAEKNKVYLSLGCKALDKLLGGKGLESAGITEFYAQYGSGKSQIGFTAIVRTVLEEPIGLNGSVIVIDTEGTFSASRLLEIKSYYNTKVTDEEFLENIHVIQPMKVSEQLNLLKEFLEDEGLGYTNYMGIKKPLKLIVIDSLTHLFRCEYVGRGTLAERQQKLNEHVRDLYLFGVKNNVIVIVTNQVIANPDPYTAQTEIAVGGNVLAHASTYRIFIKKRRDYRIASMVDSSRLPQGEAAFRLSVKGVIDVESSDEGYINE